MIKKLAIVFVSLYSCTACSMQSPLQPMPTCTVDEEHSYLIEPVDFFICPFCGNQCNSIFEHLKICTAPRSLRCVMDIPPLIQAEQPVDSRHRKSVCRPRLPRALHQSFHQAPITSEPQPFIAAPGDASKAHFIDIAFSMLMKVGIQEFEIPVSLNVHYDFESSTIKYLCYFSDHCSRQYFSYFNSFITHVCNHDCAVPFNCVICYRFCTYNVDDFKQHHARDHKRIPLDIEFDKFSIIWSTVTTMIQNRWKVGFFCPSCLRERSSSFEALLRHWHTCNRGTSSGAQS